MKLSSGMIRESLYIGAPPSDPPRWNEFLLRTGLSVEVLCHGNQSPVLAVME